MTELNFNVIKAKFVDVSLQNPPNCCTLVAVTLSHFVMRRKFEDLKHCEIKVNLIKRLKF